MRYFYIKWVCSLIFAIFCFTHHSLLKAYSSDFSVDLQTVNLPDAIRLTAKFLNKNVIISPAVQGTVVLHLNRVQPQDAFELLLLSHGLVKWRLGNIWYIAPREELLKHKQDELSWHDIQQSASDLQTQVFQIHYAKADDIAHLLKTDHESLMSKRGQIRVDVRTNILFIRDLPDHIHMIADLIKRLDVPLKQIRITARLATVDSDVEHELGIQFSTKQNQRGESQSTFMQKALSDTSHYSLAVAKLADGSLLDVKLLALEKSGQAELISSPSLFTTNQQEASIEAGEEVPYQEVSESGGTAVTFKKAVLGLKVIPQILPGGRVLLQLRINQDRPSSKMVQGVPTISTRQIITNVLVNSGETIVLGGIYELNQEQGEQGLPFINHVPLIGWLFKEKQMRKNKRELLIFITPNIMTSVR